MEKKTQSLINKYNKSVDSIKSQELAISRVKDKIVELQSYKDAGVLKDEEAGKLEELTSKLQIMQSKLSQTKEEANQTKNAINKAFKDRTQNTIKGIAKIGSTTVKVGTKISSFGVKLASAFASKTIGKSINNVSNKLGNLKNKLSRLIGGAAFISLFNGGFEKLRNTVSSVLKVNSQFSSNLNQIKANLMNAFAPIYNAVLPALNSLMSVLSQVTGTIATFVSSLFGQNLKDSTKQAKKLSSALDDTAKSGDKASGSLALFDKLEVIGGNDSGGNGNQDSIDYSGAVKSNSQLLDLFNKIKDLLSSGDWAGLAKLISEGFVNALSFVEAKIKSINWSGIGKGISDFITNIDYSGILTGLVGVFGEAVLGFQDLFLKIDFKKFFQKLSTGLKNAISKTSEYIKKIKWSEIGKKISDAITGIDWAGLGTSIINVLWNTVVGFGSMLAGIDWSAVAQSLSVAVSEWIGTILDIFIETDWIQLGKDIIDIVFDFLGGIEWGEVAKNILLGLAGGIAVFSQLVLGALGELLSKILELFGIKGDSPSEVFLDIGKKIISGLVNGLKSIMQKIIEVFSNIFNGAKKKIEEIITGILDFIKKIPQKIANAISSIPEKFREAFQKARDKVAEIWKNITKIFSAGGKIFDGIKEGIASTFKEIVNLIIKGINKVIAVPFNTVNGLLNKIRNCNIPIIDVKPFKGLWGQDPLPVPEIPRLAKGTVIPPRQEFLAILGDQHHGTNVEAPLETIKQANREVLDERERNNIQQKQTIIIERAEIILECDKREIGRASYKGLKLLEKESGKFILVS